VDGNIAQILGDMFLFTVVQYYGFALDVVVSNSHLSRNFLDSWYALQIICEDFNLGFKHY
jgi:hypothetical protein